MTVALEQLWTLAHDDDCALMAEGSHPTARCTCCLSYPLCEIGASLSAPRPVGGTGEDEALDYLSAEFHIWENEGDALKRAKMLLPILRRCLESPKENAALRREIGQVNDNLRAALTSSGGGGTAGEPRFTQQDATTILNLLNTRQGGSDERLHDYVLDLALRVKAAAALSGARVPEGGEATAHADFSSFEYPANPAAEPPTAPAPAAGSEPKAWMVTSGFVDRDVFTDRATAEHQAAFYTGTGYARVVVTPLYASPAPTAASGAEMPQVTAEDVKYAQDLRDDYPEDRQASRILAVCEYALAHQNGGAV